MLPNTDGPQVSAVLALPPRDEDVTTAAGQKGPEAARFSLGYCRPLDGVRALAVLAVVAYHSIPHASAGFFGVDLFFVLSGFLITGLLLQEHDETGRLDFRAFYVRRALRLLPALVVACILVIGLTLVRPGPSALPLATVLGAVLLYVGNWVNAFNGTGLGYFGHSWSLAIEEQFYVIWPFVLLRLLSRADRLLRRILIVAISIGVLRAAIWLTWHQSGLRDWSILAGDELLAGAAAATLLWRRRGRVTVSVRVVSCAVGVMTALGLMLRTESKPLLIGGYTAFAACAATCILYVATSSEALLARMLSWSPLVAIGRVSYGVYLFHFPIFVYLQSTRLSLPAQLLTGYLSTTALTVLSYRLVEQPFLRRKPKRVTVARA